MIPTDDAQRETSPVVLVADDDPFLRLVVREALARVGLTAVEAEDGREALSMYRRIRPALVLLDLVMPEMDGFAVCTELRRLPGGDRTPILIMTGLDDEASITRAYQAGATDFITKPISEMVLGQRVLYMLRASRTVRELIDSQARVEAQAALLDIAQDAMIVSDLEGRLEYWNRGAERLYGWTAPEAIGRRILDLVCAEPSLSIPELRARVSVDGGWRGEVTHKTKEGKAVIVDSRWTLVRSADGTPRSILMVNSDITEKKQLERQLLRAQRLESLGTLASGIAHDMNNVLTPIMLAAKLLRTEEADSTNRKYLETIESSARRGAEMTRKVLLFARGAEGQRRPIPLSPLLRELEGLLKESLTPSIELNTTCPDDTWEVMGDSTQLYQLLMNLCVNARDAMPTGGRLWIDACNVLLTAADVAGHPSSKPGPYVQLSVKDSGSGIAPDVMEKIFDPFFTTKETGRGTGLGLSTVSGVAKSHGGFVTVASEVGEGTTFQVFLPAIEAVRIERKGYAPAGELRGQGELVLVVDDDDAVLRMTRDVLHASGYRVVTATNGAEAVDLYAHHPERIDCVVMDLMMPGMDGSAAIRALRECNGTAKILAVSGVPASINREDDRSAVPFLQKPYSPQTLLATLQRELHRPADPAPVER